MFEKNKINIKYNELISKITNKAHKQESSSVNKLFKEQFFHSSINNKKEKKEIQYYYKYIPSIIFACFALNIISPSFNNDLKNIFCPGCNTISQTSSDGISHKGKLLTSQELAKEIQMLKKLPPTFSFNIDTPGLSHKVNIHISESPLAIDKSFFQKMDGSESLLVLSSDTPLSQSTKLAIQTRIDDFILNVSNNKELKENSDIKKKIQSIHKEEAQLLDDLKGFLN